MCNVNIPASGHMGQHLPTDGSAGMGFSQVGKAHRTTRQSTRGGAAIDWTKLHNGSTYVSSCM